ncbi:MAG TPA: glycogen/starch synthase [Thermoanaerobaculia bacterium]
MPAAALKILFLAAEAAPLVKVGGLADVIGSLPQALRDEGHDVRVAIPGYGAIDWARLAPQPRARFPVPTGSGDQMAEIFETRVGDVPHWLVTGPPIPQTRTIYGAGIEEDGPKFIFFSLAALWACQSLDWKPDLVHAHDYHAGAAVLWLATSARFNDYFRSVASVFTIHNLPYAGQGAGQAMGFYQLSTPGGIFVLPEAYRDSLLGVALLTADWLSTVSPTYAREIQTPEGGRGLESVLRARADHLSGITNGIDVDLWNPATDSALASRYDAGSIDTREKNKAALQREAGLAAVPRSPLAAVVSRIDAHQKGMDIAAAALPGWLASGGQFLLLGTGDPTLEQQFARLELSFPGRASVRLRFDAAYARRIYAGADLLLVPSRYEPCGLTQMIGMRYGAVPVARRTGGLADTVVDAGDPGGTGLMFDEPRPEALADALARAARVYADAGAWRELVRRGMAKDFSWKRSAREYARLYERAIRQKRA